MNKTDWAYRQGYDVALRSLGAKADSSDVDTTEFDKRAEPLIKNAKTNSDIQLDVERYNEAEKFINDVDGPILQEIFKAKQTVKGIIADINTLLSIGDSEGVPISNDNYAELGAQLQKLSDLVATYDELATVTTTVVRAAMDKYTPLMARVTGQN